MFILVGIMFIRGANPQPILMIMNGRPSSIQLTTEAELESKYSKLPSITNYVITLTFDLLALRLKKALQDSHVIASKLYPKALSPHTVHFRFSFFAFIFLAPPCWDRAASASMSRAI